MNKYQDIANQVIKEVAKEIGKIEVVYKFKNPWSGRAYFKRTPYLIEVPEKIASDIGLFTFLHELGHLLPSTQKQKKSCLREYYSSEFAIETFKRFGLSLSRKIRRHNNWHIGYGLAQALNRGMKITPPELRKFRKYIHNTTYGGYRAISL